MPSQDVYTTPAPAPKEAAATKVQLASAVKLHRSWKALGGVAASSYN